MAPKNILDTDLETYNLGVFTKSGKNILINGRTYELKNEGKTLFPVSGGAPEFIDLTRGQIKAIQLLKNVPAAAINKALEGAKIFTEEANFAKEFIKKY